jgi:hypothetical protein
MSSNRYKGQFLSSKHKGKLVNLSKSKFTPDLNDKVQGLDDNNALEAAVPDSNNINTDNNIASVNDIVVLNVDDCDIVPVYEAVQVCEKPCVIEGRRIVDIAYLAQQMVCITCQTLLHLTDIASELQMGLASILSIICPICQHLNRVSTGQRHGGPNGPFDINTKAALGT